MKKILLIATIGVAGLLSAKGLEETKIETCQEGKTPPDFICTQVDIPIWCTGETITNSYCWIDGDQASFTEALECYETEYEMFNEELCK